MTDAELDQLAADWILFWKSPEGSSARQALDYVMDREYDLVREEPETAWRLILAILQLDTTAEAPDTVPQMSGSSPLLLGASPRIAEVLSAGPLEDLLAKHGDDFIDRVEVQARSDAGFASLLGGVWRNAMSESVWSRVQKVWNRSGWDSNP